MQGAFPPFEYVLDGECISNDVTYGNGNESRITKSGHLDGRYRPVRVNQLVEALYAIERCTPILVLGIRTVGDKDILRLRRCVGTDPETRTVVCDGSMRLVQAEEVFEVLRGTALPLQVLGHTVGGQDVILEARRGRHGAAYARLHNGSCF